MSAGGGFGAFDCTCVPPGRAVAGELGEVARRRASRRRGCPGRRRGRSAPPAPSPRPALISPGENPPPPAGRRTVSEPGDRHPGPRLRSSFRDLGWGEASCTFSSTPPRTAAAAAPKKLSGTPPTTPTTSSAIVTPMADRTFAKFTFFKVDSRLAPPRRRAARRRQAGVPRRLRGLRHRPVAARLLNHRHARRRRPGPAQPEPQPRRHPHLPRRPRPERPGEVGRDALLVPLDDQTLALLRRAGAAGDLRLRAQVPVPLPDGQAAPLVRAAARGARPDHEKPHRGRSPLPRDHDQHDLLVRDRRPGVRRLLRGRRPGRCSSTSSTSCARPSRASTRSWRRRSSPASRCRSAKALDALDGTPSAVAAAAADAPERSGLVLGFPILPRSDEQDRNRRQPRFGSPSSAPGRRASTPPSTSSRTRTCTPRSTSSTASRPPSGWSAAASPPTTRRSSR